MAEEMETVIEQGRPEEWRDIDSTAGFDTETELLGDKMRVTLRLKNQDDPGAHYRFSYKGIKLDPFRICSIYGVTDFGQQTLVKKSLRLGTSIKDRKQDLLDIINCANRMLEMMEEDAANA